MNLANQRYFYSLLLVAITVAAAFSAAPSWTTSASTVRSWSTDKFDELIDKYGSYGGAFAIVRNGEILVSHVKGESRIGTDWDEAKTLFRLGGTSKAFAHTTFWREYSHGGKFKLSENVNDYVRDNNIWRVDLNFLEPVTISHLLTGTSGFDNQILGQEAITEARRKALSTYTEYESPSRVYPPGRYHAEKNFDTVLLAYLMEQETGDSYEDLVSSDIFDKANMTSTHQRLKASIAADSNLARSYPLKKGSLPSGISGGADNTPYNLDAYMNSWPAMGAISTLSDCTSFMRGLLGTSAASTTPATTFMAATAVNAMFAEAWTFDELSSLASSMASGWHRRKQENVTLLEVTGDFANFHSGFHLIPEQNTGIFMVTNTEGGDNVQTDFLDAFLREYFEKYHPEWDSALENNKFFHEEASKYQGFYYSLTHSQSTFFKIFNILQYKVVVYPQIVEDDRVYLSVDGREYIEEEPLVFRAKGDIYNTLAFQIDDDGSVTYMFGGEPENVTAPTSHNVYKKFEPINAPLAEYVYIGLCVVIFVSSWWWPVVALLQFASLGSSVPDITDHDLEAGDSDDDYNTATIVEMPSQSTLLALAGTTSDGMMRHRGLPTRGSQHMVPEDSEVLQTGNNNANTTTNNNNANNDPSAILKRLSSDKMSHSSTAKHETAGGGGFSSSQQLPPVYSHSAKDTNSIDALSVSTGSAASGSHVGLSAAAKHWAILYYMLSGPRLMRVCAFVTCHLNLAFMLGMTIVISPFNTSASGLIGGTGVSAPILLLFTLPLISFVLTVLMGVSLTVAWLFPWWEENDIATCNFLSHIQWANKRLVGKTHYTVVVAGCILFLVLLNEWNMFGYDFNVQSTWILPVGPGPEILAYLDAEEPTPEHVIQRLMTYS
jgi:CubicO group peptidase (beta-lactamase class C family)